MGRSVANRIARLTSNPLLIRETRRPTRITARSVLKYSFSLSFIITVFAVVGVIFGNGESGHVSLMLALFSLAVVSVPPYVAYTAAVLTVIDRQSKQFDLVHITTISNARLIEGYNLSVMYRSRALFLAIIGFAPLAIVWAVYMSVSFCTDSYFTTAPPCQPISSASVFVSLLSFMVLGINVGGICLLSIVLGVFLGAWWGSRFLSSTVALLITLITITCLIFASVNFSVAVLLERNLLFLPGLYLAYILFVRVIRPLARPKT